MIQITKFESSNAMVRTITNIVPTGAVITKERVYPHISGRTSVDWEYLDTHGTTWMDNDILAEHKLNSRFQIYKVRYARTTEKGDIFSIHWLGYEEEDATDEFVGDLLDDIGHTFKAEFDGIKAKCITIRGTKNRNGQYHEPHFRSWSGCKIQTTQKIVSSDDDDTKVKHRSTTDSCVINAVLNSSKISNRLAKRLRKECTHLRFCGLNDMAVVVAKKPFCIELRHSSVSKEEMIQRYDGSFIVACQVHCVAIDCTSHTIIDCARSSVLDLTEENLKICEINSFDEVREVVCCKKRKRE